MNRRCIDCRTMITDATRCSSCQSKRRRRYGSTWTRTSKAIRAVVQVCEWCTATEDLCVDHIVPGDINGGLRVLCRRCNSRRVHGYSGPSGGAVGRVGGLPSRPSDAAEGDPAPFQTDPTTPEPPEESPRARTGHTGPDQAFTEPRLEES